MSLIDAISKLKIETPLFEPGHVWLAGAGPGSLDNLTLGVVKAMSEADALVYDALVNPDILQAAPQAELHFVGKRAGKPSISQTAINEIIIRLAHEGKRVLRLKGGDPNVFGRGAEEAACLIEAGIPFRFLPGITSAFGALANVAIPATMRGVNKAIILATGHGADDSLDLDWAALAKTGQPIVIYMGMRRMGMIISQLLQGGLAPQTPSAIIMSGTLNEERVLIADLANLETRAKEAGFASPSLIVIGEIVAHQLVQTKENRREGLSA